MIKKVKTKNKRELKVLEELEAQGYEVYKRGYPDFLVYDPIQDKIFFIEVKGITKEHQKPGRYEYHSRALRTRGIKNYQQRVCELLNKIADVYIERVC